MKSLVLTSLATAVLAADKGINPNPNQAFDPATNPGNFGPFFPFRQAAPQAIGGPRTVDPRTAQAMQLAMSNWMTDTGIVSGFQNIGQSVDDEATFRQIADGAFKAEVDELIQKSVLDAVIGNDPRVSIANLTLTNGVFQSVVDNLQIMSFQGKNKQNLIDAINNVRCTQILPSIDTYMIVAAQVIGDNAQQRRAVRPTACAQILANNAQNISAFPNVPGVPGGVPLGLGDGNVPGVPGVGQQGGGNLTFPAAGAGTGAAGNGNTRNGAGRNRNQNANGGVQSVNAGNQNANAGTRNIDNTNAGNQQGNIGNQGTNNNDKTTNGGTQKVGVGKQKAADPTATTTASSNNDNNNGNTATQQQGSQNFDVGNVNGNANTAIGNGNGGGGGNINAAQGTIPASQAANKPLPYPTTPQLGLPGFPNAGTNAPLVPLASAPAAVNNGNANNNANTGTANNGTALQRGNAGQGRSRFGQGANAGAGSGQQGGRNRQNGRRSALRYFG